MGRQGAKTLHLTAQQDQDRQKEEQKKAAEARKGKPNPVVFLEIEAGDV